MYLLVNRPLVWLATVGPGKAKWWASILATVQLLFLNFSAGSDLPLTLLFWLRAGLPAGLCA